MSCLRSAKACSGSENWSRSSCTTSPLADETDRRGEPLRESHTKQRAAPSRSTEAEQGRTTVSGRRASRRAVPDVHSLDSLDSAPGCRQESGQDRWNEKVVSLTRAPKGMNSPVDVAATALVNEHHLMQWMQQQKESALTHRKNLTVQKFGPSDRRHLNGDQHSMLLLSQWLRSYSSSVRLINGFGGFPQRTCP
jgi:hypothetical protein